MKEVNGMNKTVLFVDDEPVIRNLALNFLSGEYNIMTARNGKIAVDIYKKEFKNIDVIILDLNMPVMCGREAFSELISFNSAVKVIIYSGYPDGESVQNMLKNGALAYLKKPLSFTELSLVIDTVLSLPL